MPFVPSVSVLSVAVQFLVDMVPAAVEDDGGTILVLTGAFGLSLPHQVVVIVNAVEIPCYSAKSGDGFNPLPDSTSRLTFAAPPLPIGGPYDIKVTQGASSDTLAAALTVVARNWLTKVFDLRRLWPQRWRTGRRNLDTQPILLTTLTAGFIDDQAAVQTVAYSLTPKTLDPLGTGLTWSSVGTALPAWVTLTPAGPVVLSGTPAAPDVGTTSGHQLEVTDGTTTVQTNLFDLVVT